MNEPLLLKTFEAARLLSISPRKLWSLTDEGRIPAIRLGKAWRYSREALQDWIRRGCQNATCPVQSTSWQNNDLATSSAN
jgi:excisionase family DNA binding protein